VACEGVPALLKFTIRIGIASGERIALNGNVLDVAIIQTSPKSSTMVVSIDNIHKPGSTTEVRGDKVSKSPAS
jgi:tRNA (guanine-N(7)-)-methyltransferase subunit TRM82